MPVYWLCKSTDRQNWLILPELILFSPHHLISLTLPYIKYYKKVLFWEYQYRKQELNWSELDTYFKIISIEVNFKTLNR